jgi:hypothetical protein
VRQREKGININAALCGEPKLLHYTNDDGGQIQGACESISRCSFVVCGSMITIYVIIFLHRYDCTS